MSPSAKTWPTSMPRRISSVPRPSGEGRPPPHCGDRPHVGLPAIPAEIDAAKMEIALVGAADEIGHDRDRAVDDERKVRRNSDGSE